MNAFSSVILFGLGIASAGILADRASGSRGHSDAAFTLLSAFIFFFSIVIGSFLLAGYLELITGVVSVTTTAAAVLSIVVLAIAVLCSKSDRRMPVRSIWRGLICLYEALAQCARYARNTEPRLLVLAVAFLILMLALSAFVVGYPRGTEAASYHLPNGLHALQTASLRLRDPIYYSALPANDGIWYAFLLSMLPERFVAMGQLPFLPALALAVYGIARGAGGDARASTFSAAGILSIPLVTLQGVSAESDAVGLTFLAVSLYFVTGRELPPTRYVLAGLALGLALGFKSLLLIAGGIIGALAAIESYWHAPTARRALLNCTGLCIAAFLTSSFWMVRNYVETGNPLYPIYVHYVFDLLGWPPAWDIDYSQFLESEYSWVRSKSEWFVYPWIEWHYADAGTQYKGNAGLGAFFAATIPVAWAYSALEVLRRTSKGIWDDAAKVRVLMVIGGSLVIGAWFLIGNREPRYASSALIFLCPLAGYMVTSVEGSARKALETLLSACILWMFFAFCAKELITFGDRIVYSRHFSRDRYYEYPAQVDRLPAGTTILNMDNRATNYPLAGSKLTNKVVDYQWAVRTFGIDVTARGTHNLSIGTDTKGIVLEAEKLRRLGVTHIYFRLGDHIRQDGCVVLRELDRIDRNPVSGALLNPPKVLSKVEYCQASQD